MFTSTDVRNSDKWDHAAVLTASDGSSADFFGSSVRMPNRNTIVIGAPGDEVPGGATSAGSIYVFTGNGSNWDQVQRITYTGAATSSKYGFNRAIAATQKEIFVGSSDEPTGPSTETNNPEKIIRYRI